MHVILYNMLSKIGMLAFIYLKNSIIDRIPLKSKSSYRLIKNILSD